MSHNKINIKEFVEKMSDEELQKIISVTVTEDIECGKDELIDAAIDECNKRKLSVLVEHK